MPIRICPHCDKRYSISPNSGDFIHNCNDFPQNTTLAKEDIVIVETQAVDFDGTFTRGKAEVNMAGVENELQGTRAGIEGEDFEGVTERGARKITHRSRSHLEYIGGSDNG